MNRTTVGVILFLLCLPMAANGEENPPEDVEPLSQLEIIYKRQDVSGEALELALPDVIRYALEKNPDIRIEKLAVPIVEQSVGEEQAVFDPVIESKLGTSKSRMQSASTLEGATMPERTSTETDVSLKQKMAAGGTWGLSLTNNRGWSNNSYATLNPEYDAALRLDISQPLLKSFGREANAAGIQQAENNVIIAEQMYRRKIMAAVADTMNAYWELMFTIMDLQVREVALKQAMQLLDENRARFQAGTVPQTDLLASEAGVAQRQADILRARAAIEAEEDRIKLLIEASAIRENGWDLPISPQTAPRIEEMRDDFTRCMEAALAYRPDYQSFLCELKNRRIELKYRRNQLWPSLNLDLSGELAGLGGDLGEAHNNAASTDYYSAAGSIVLRVPLGRRAERSAFYRARLELAQTELRFERLKQTVVAELRDALRRLSTARKEIDAIDSLRNAEWKRLQAERRRLEAGKTTSSDVLSFQEGFAVAQRRYIRSLIDYNQALVDLHRSRGTLLEYVNVQVVY